MRIASPAASADGGPAPSQLDVSIAASQRVKAVFVTGDLLGLSYLQTIMAERND